MNKIDFSNEQLQSVHRNVSQNVATIRKSKKITQLDLALTIGYSSASVIAKSEAGTENRHFSIEQLFKISKALNVPIESFFQNINQIK